jgi:hypothetical protein
MPNSVQYLIFRSRNKFGATDKIEIESLLFVPFLSVIPLTIAFVIVVIYLTDSLSSAFYLLT